MSVIKSWKTIALVVLFTLLGLGWCTLTASAEDAASTNQTPLAIFINGKYISLDGDPITINDHTLVPIKPILENLGIAFTWNDSSQTITASQSTTTVSLTIGSYNALVNGKYINLDEAPQTIDGKTYAPLVFVVETFGGKIIWDNERQIMEIYSGSGQKGQMTIIPTPTTNQPGQANSVPETTSQPSGQVTAVSVIASDLNLRSGPSTSSDAIGLVPCGTILAYVGQKDGWYQVNYQGQTAWVASWLVTPPQNTSMPSRGKTATLLPVPSTPDDYVKQMKPYAEEANKGTGLPVDFLLAQWAEESGYGTSTLAQYYNNFGGIKDPDSGGFKQYFTPDEFAQDVIVIYTQNSKYSRLLDHAQAGASIRTLFSDLTACHYASSSNYGEKIRTQYLPEIDAALEKL